MKTSVDSYEELREHEKNVVIAVLRQLLTACCDDQSGYAQAALDVNEPSLQPVYEEYARQRAAFADQLQEPSCRSTRRRSRRCVGRWASGRS